MRYLLSPGKEQRAWGKKKNEFRGSSNYFGLLNHVSQNTTLISSSYKSRRKNVKIDGTSLPFQASCTN
jgi:hypothetical protein